MVDLEAALALLIMFVAARFYVGACDRLKGGRS
jgi:hypothetical protein